jgi:hypothetical protein
MGFIGRKDEFATEPGIHVDHSTVHRWVAHFAPLLLERFNRRKRPVTGGGTLMKLMSGCAVAGCIFTARSTAARHGRVLLQREPWTCRRRNASCAKRWNITVGRIASSLTAARRTGKQLLPAMARAGFETNRNGHCCRSASGRTDTFNNRDRARPSSDQAASGQCSASSPFPRPPSYWLALRWCI